MDAAAERLLREHLPYELDMLEWAYGFVNYSRYEEQRKDVAARNAAIECFWTHARNLYEFMTKTGRGTAQGLATASDFVDKPFHPDLPFGKIDEKMNQQIVHLQYERVSSLDGKLDGYEMKRFKESLDRAVKLFESKLSDNARAVWQTRGQALSIEVQADRSATNAIQSGGTTASIHVVSTALPPPKQKT